MGGAEPAGRPGEGPARAGVHVQRRRQPDRRLGLGNVDGIPRPRRSGCARTGSDAHRDHRDLRAAVSRLRTARRRHRPRRRVLGVARERTSRQVRAQQVQGSAQRAERDRKALPRGLDALPLPRPAVQGRSGRRQRGGELLHLGGLVRQLRSRQERADRLGEHERRVLRPGRRQMGHAARALSDGLLRQVVRRAHRRSECRLEGKIAVGDLLHADGVPRRRRQGEPAQSREVPAPSRSARELTATRSLRMLYRGAVDSLALAAALLFCLAPASAEPRFSFATTPGKLPKDVVHKHYALRIAPAATYDRFDGEAVVDIEVARPVPAIVVNAAELSFKSARLRASTGGETILTPGVDPQRETVTLTPASSPIAPGSYRLGIDYSGKIGKHPQGLYQIAYKERERGRLVEKLMLATQMEPVQARRLFPGWDEPVFRASFDIVAVIDASLTAVSNMPQSKVELLPDGRKEVSFARSVPMSTYLVALFVGEMDLLEDSVDGIRLGIHTVKGKRERARYAMEATKQIVRYYNDYFGEPYPLAKLDQLAIPGGIPGAMENWGAIAYNEGRFLYDPGEDSLRQQQAAYGIIAHEIAHQWFGNLVTMAWWDNLWLNEGFASWMASKATERFNPRWGMRLRDALWKETALAEDARRTTHPVQTPVENDTRAMDVFDSITYAKGAAVLRMLEGYLGEDVFRAGVRGYTRAHRFSNTTTADFWHHLSGASGQVIGKLVAGWTEQPAYLVVKVLQQCENGAAAVTLAQERFTLNDPGAAPLAWNVPVILADGAGRRRTVLLEREPQKLGFERCGEMLANAGDTGYYRSQYDDGNFRRLALALKRLPASDRLRLLSDTLALAQAGRFDATPQPTLRENPAA